MSEIKLKPCPFCGAAADIWEEGRGEDGLKEVWVVGCLGCPVEMVGNRDRIFADEKQLLVKTWNQRA